MHPAGIQTASTTPGHTHIRWKDTNECEQRNWNVVSRHDCVQKLYQNRTTRPLQNNYFESSCISVQNCTSIAVVFLGPARFLWVCTGVLCSYKTLAFRNNIKSPDVWPKWDLKLQCLTCQKCAVQIWGRKTAAVGLFEHSSLLAFIRIFVEDEVCNFCSNTFKFNIQSHS